MSSTLVLYSVMLFYPGGDVASGASVVVMLHGSNVEPLLFADVAGAVPLAVPVTADGDGIIMFYAAPGHYEAELAGDTFHVPIDPSFTDPVWPDLWVHEQSSPASVWTVDHHFGVEPVVQVLVDGGVVGAEVAHPTVEQTVVTFSVPTVGVAQLRR